MIQWFPGHMAKTKRQIIENLRLVDIVYELVDARIPFSSRNPLIDEIVKNKPRLVIMTKADMADDSLTKKHVSTFERQNISVVVVDASKNLNKNIIFDKTKEILSEKIAKDAKKGIINRPIRIMILGIPNVGKSTLINRLVDKKVTNVGDRPGITTSKQWIRLNPSFELLDTPGVLWPKFEDQEVGYKLALTGAIKDDILHLDDSILYFLDFLRTYYPQSLINRYEIDISMSNLEVLDHIGKKRGLIKNNEVLYERVYDVILNDFRNLYLGKITLDR